MVFARLLASLLMYIELSIIGHHDEIASYNMVPLDRLGHSLVLQVKVRVGEFLKVLRRYLPTSNMEEHEE